MTSSEIQVERAGMYSAYGLRIRSCIALRSFPAGDGSGHDVSVTFGDADRQWAERVGGLEQSLEIEDSEARFWFRDAGAMIVRNGEAIVVAPRGGDSGAPELDLVRLYVEGMIMAMLLHQRGLCVLHASVIEMGGAAIACMGHIGAGKSSTAATLYRRGYRILTDDNAAIHTGAEVPVVVPAYPSVKLFPSIAASLGFRGSELAMLHEAQSKMAGDVTKNFSDRALPLATIYVLGRHYPPGVTRLSRLQAAIELIRNAVPTRWGQQGDPRQFRQCSALAMQVPVFAIRTFQDLAGLPAMVDDLERHQSARLKATASPAARLCPPEMWSPERRVPPERRSGARIMRGRR